MRNYKSKKRRAINAADEINSLVEKTTAKVHLYDEEILVNVFVEYDDDDFMTHTCEVEAILKKHRIPIGDNWEESWMAAGWR